MQAVLSAFPERTGGYSALSGCLTLASAAAGSAVVGILLQSMARTVTMVCGLTFVAGTAILSAGTRQPIPVESEN